MIETWNISLEIYRQLVGAAGRYQRYSLEVNPDETVLDVIERIWAEHDRGLVYRHACHHSTCGACGMRVNGVEKLACITPVRTVCADGGQVRLEPLRSFPVVADLLVDMSAMYRRTRDAGFEQTAPLDAARLPYEPPIQGEGERLVDCIECGMCISACPISLTNPAYLGPAVLAAVHHEWLRSGSPAVLETVDHENGAWRCHSAFECSAVCPSNVDPGWRIMDLRRQLIKNRIRRFFFPTQR